MQTRYIYNALPVESQAMDLVKAAAKQHSIAVVLGFAEQSPSYSVYISQAIISPQGELLLHRRKIKPSHMERTIFGDGFGGDLTNVVVVDFGPQHGRIKVGCLACWEHTQPLLKYRMSNPCSLSPFTGPRSSLWLPRPPAPLFHASSPDAPTREKKKN
jgi:predicted amidohydrolase